MAGNVGATPAIGAPGVQLGQCGSLPPAAAAAIQSPLDLLSLASLASVRPISSHFAAGNSLLNTYAMMPTEEAMQRNPFLAQLYGTSPAATPPTMATGAATNVGKSFQGSTVPSIPTLDDSLAALVNTLAAAKAEEAIRQASSAALRLPSASPTGLESHLQNGLNQAELACLLPQSQRAAGPSDQGLVEPQISLARALALSSQSPSQSAGT